MQGLILEGAEATEGSCRCPRGHSDGSGLLRVGGSRLGQGRSLQTSRMLWGQRDSARQWRGQWRGWWQLIIWQLFLLNNSSKGQGGGMNLKCLPIFFFSFFYSFLMILRCESCTDRGGMRWWNPRAHWGCFSLIATAMVGEYRNIRSRCHSTGHPEALDEVSSITTTFPAGTWSLLWCYRPGGVISLINCPWDF